MPLAALGLQQSVYCCAGCIVRCLRDVYGAAVREDFSDSAESVVPIAQSSVSVLQNVLQNRRVIGGR